MLNEDRLRLLLHLRDASASLTQALMYAQVDREQTLTAVEYVRLVEATTTIQGLWRVVDDVYHKER